MKTIIAGGRDYKLTLGDVDFLTKMHENGLITHVITGGATGVDLSAHEWAGWHNIPREVFRADWRTYGSAAGPIRNREMAERAAPYGQCILFPGGRGTQSMATCAEYVGISIIDRRITA